MTGTDFVQTELCDAVWRVTLNRPKANAFNFEMIDGLKGALKQAARDDAVRCVLLTGSGSVFSAGQDIKEFGEAGGASLRQHLQNTYNLLILQIRGLDKPVIAAVNGPVAGAALGIVLACDLRIAADNARFVVGFLGIGLAPDSAVSLFLPQLIGLGRAAEYAFSNDPISAEQALDWGLVNRMVPAAELPQKALDWAIAISHGPIHAMGLAKRDFNKAVLGNLDGLLDYEAHVQEIAGKGSEHKEGVQAFLEKRAPRFV